MHQRAVSLEMCRVIYTFRNRYQEKRNQIRKNGAIQNTSGICLFFLGVSDYVGTVCCKGIIEFTAAQRLGHLALSLVLSITLSSTFLYPNFPARKSEITYTQSLHTFKQWHNCDTS